MSPRGTVLAAVLLAIASGCMKKDGMGPLEGVLIVFPDGGESAASAFSDSLQKFVNTVYAEPVFSFSFVPAGSFTGDLRRYRTIVLVTGEGAGYPALPGGLSMCGTFMGGRDVWATGQRVFAAEPGSTDIRALSDSLASAYEEHLLAYIYQSFVSTQMSSPERMDSLASLGFVMDVPKAYETTEWDPGRGFVQFQRRVDEEGLIMISIRWLDSDSVPTAEEAVGWRQEMARRFFYDASADSVDRARLSVSPCSISGARGWELVGAWRNPEHVNAGAFASYVLQAGSRRYILDAEVYNPGEEKELYIREGRLIMKTFVPEG